MVLKLYCFIVDKIIGRLEFSSLKYLFTGRFYDLRPEDIRSVLAHMSQGRYVCLLRRKTHFTTYLIGFSNLILNRKFGYWSHAFLHVEDGTQDHDIEILEAVGSGVKTSDWWDVLDCDAVVLLKPKNYTEDQLENTIKYARSLIGTPYDNFFDLKSIKALSCVEYAFTSLLHENVDGLPLLTSWVKRVNNLTPDMLYECGDFDIILEVRR